MAEKSIQIELKNLSFLREGRALLDEVSIQVETQSCAVVVGIAGSGKTTLLKAAAGLLIPDSGFLEINGKNINDYSKQELRSLRKKDGFVFQDAALWENISIRENLSLPVQFHYPDIPQEVIQSKIDYWIERTGFWDTIEGRPAAYSMGEKKMISFIRALITEPKLLYLDNPTEMLDTSGVNTILRILKEQKKKGVTMLISSQHPEIIGKLADRLIVIDEGKIIESGNSEQIFTSVNETTKKVMKHVREAEGIDYNELMTSVESALDMKDRNEFIDISDSIGEE
jgi:ABC-type multidrug transport system ATPase subunit